MHDSTQTGKIEDSVEKTEESDNSFKKWGRNFTADLKNPQLMPLKALLFLVFGGNSIADRYLINN